MAPILLFCPSAVRSEQSLVRLHWLTTPLRPCRSPLALRWSRPNWKQHDHLLIVACYICYHCYRNTSNLNNLPQLVFLSVCTVHQPLPLQSIFQFCWVALRRCTCYCSARSHHNIMIAVHWIRWCSAAIVKGMLLSICIFFYCSCLPWLISSWIFLSSTNCPSSSSSLMITFRIWSYRFVNWACMGSCLSYYLATKCSLISCMTFLYCYCNYTSFSFSFAA